MKGLSAAIVLFASAALAQESTPFAQQPYRAGAETPSGSLSDMMAISQMRHIKVWRAAKAGNWPLASYEADKLRDSLSAPPSPTRTSPFRWSKPATRRWAPCRRRRRDAMRGPSRRRLAR